MLNLYLLAARFNSALRKVLLLFAAANLILIVAILLQVALRPVLGGATVLLGELQWHFYSLAFMFGIVYNQTVSAHVRVDVFARNFSERSRRIIEIFGLSLLMLPFLWVMFFDSLDFVAVAWRVAERSDSPVGLPARWLIKSVMPATFALLALAIAARVLGDIAWLAGARDEDAGVRPGEGLAMIGEGDKSAENGEVIAMIGEDDKAAENGNGLGAVKRGSSSGRRDGV